MRPNILMTSLKEIHNFSPCSRGWLAIVRAKKSLGSTTEFPLKDCLESNTALDVCWLLEKRNTELAILAVYDDARSRYLLRGELYTSIMQEDMKKLLLTAIEQYERGEHV